MLDAVHVWRIPLHTPPPADLLAVLDAREARRAAGFTEPAHRRRYAVAHGATRQILAAYLDARPADLAWRLGPSGKPELDGLRVNLSHSGDLALLAVTAHRDVGVDVERMRADLPIEALAARYFRADEAARVLAAAGAERIWWFWRIWTRKEACVKAAGARLTQGLGLPVGGLPDDRGRGLRCTGSGAVDGTWTVRDLPLADGSVGAVALAGAQDYCVAVRTWRYAHRGAPARRTP